MAYGITVTSVTATQCSLRWRHTLKIFTAKLGADNVPHVFVSANGKNLMLGRLFLKMGKYHRAWSISIFTVRMWQVVRSGERFYIKD
jgi:hypothetical protein